MTSVGTLHAADRVSRVAQGLRVQAENGLGECKPEEARLSADYTAFAGLPSHMLAPEASFVPVNEVLECKFSPKPRHSIPARECQQQLTCAETQFSAIAQQLLRHTGHHRRHARAEHKLTQQNMQQSQERRREWRSYLSF